MNAEVMAGLDDLTDELAQFGVGRGTLFGKPSLVLNKKAIVCGFQDGVAFKLAPHPHAEALALSGAQLFDPSGRGRPMKEWVHIPVAHAADWPRFGLAAVHYLRG